MTKPYQSFRLPFVVCLLPGKAALVHLTSKKTYLGSPRAGNSHSRCNQCQGFFFFFLLLFFCIALSSRRPKSHVLCLQVPLRSSGIEHAEAMPAHEAKRRGLRAWWAPHAPGDEGNGRWAPHAASASPIAGLGLPAPPLPVPRRGAAGRRAMRGHGGVEATLGRPGRSRWPPSRPCCPPQAEPAARDGLRGRGRAPGGRLLHSSQKRSGGGERAGCIPTEEAGDGQGPGGQRGRARAGRAGGGGARRPHARGEPRQSRQEEGSEGPQGWGYPGCCRRRKARCGARLAGGGCRRRGRSRNPRRGSAPSPAGGAGGHIPFRPLLLHRPRLPPGPAAAPSRPAP